MPKKKSPKKTLFGKTSVRLDLKEIDSLYGPPWLPTEPRQWPDSRDRVSGPSRRHDICHSTPSLDEFHHNQQLPRIQSHEGDQPGVNYDMLKATADKTTATTEHKSMILASKSVPTSKTSPVTDMPIILPTIEAYGFPLERRKTRVQNPCWWKSSTLLRSPSQIYLERRFSSLKTGDEQRSFRAWSPPLPRYRLFNPFGSPGKDSKAKPISPAQTANPVEFLLAEPSSFGRKSQAFASSTLFSEDFEARLEQGYATTPRTDQNIRQFLDRVKRREYQYPMDRGNPPKTNPFAGYTDKMYCTHSNNGPEELQAPDISKSHLSIQYEEELKHACRQSLSASCESKRISSGGLIPNKDIASAAFNSHVLGSKYREGIPQVKAAPRPSKIPRLKQGSCPAHILIQPLLR